jgi:hypothetical protein
MVVATGVLAVGIAVQDFWMPNAGGFGTNLRTYNPDTESWEIVWTANKFNGLMHISAKQNDDGDIVMDVLKAVQDPPRRIMFFAPDENGWNWLMQMSFDAGESWTDVYRIKATPRGRLIIGPRCAPGRQLNRSCARFRLH